MRAGRLRHRVQLQRRVAGSPQQTASGAPDEAWSTVVTVWASVEPLRGRELLTAQQTQSEVTGVILIRYRSGVDAGMRAVHGSTVYNIVAVIDRGERHQEIELHVQRGLNRG